jgi:hypothetical protein
MDSLPIFNEPRTWKYAVPVALAILLITVADRMKASTNAEIQYWTALPFAIGLLLVFVGIVNWWRLVSAHREEMFNKHQEALSMTPLVLLSQNMKQMHPEAVRVLNRFGVRTNWEVTVSANLGQRDWVLMGTNVHFGFVEYVLSRSGKALYPKRNFTQGSKKWDPDGLVEDRVQYEEFELWMFSRLMVTRSHGDFRSAEFIQPWTPKGIMETLGLTGEQDLYYPVEGKLKDLGVTTTQPTVKTNGNGNGHNASAVVDPDLSEEQLEVIALENMKYAQNLKGDSQ